MSNTRTLRMLFCASLLTLSPAMVAAAPASAPAAASTPTSRPSPTSMPAAASRPAGASSKPSVGVTSRPVDRQTPNDDVERADGLFALGRYGEALALYEQGYAQRPARVGLLLRIAGCQERLGGEGRLRKAKANYRSYLTLRPKSSARRQIEKRIALLDQRIEKGGLGLDAHDPAGTPAYKKWWFWAGLIVVVGAVVTGIILASQVDDDIPQTSQPLRSPASRGGVRWLRSPVLFSF